MLVAVVVALVLVAPVPALADGARRDLADGAWSWFADPRGVHFHGVHRRTYVGWVSRGGDIEVSSFDHDTGARVTANLHPKLEEDDHANPALWVGPDGRLVVFYARHGGREMYYRVSTDPEDVTSWQSAQVVPTNTSGPYGYTYPNPIYLPSERKLYLFWRGGNWNPTYSTLSEGSGTWTPAHNLISVPGQRPYVKYAADGDDTVSFAFTNAHPRASDVNIYFAYARGGEIFKANGKRIGALGTPISPSQADKVYDTTWNAWIHDLTLDSSGRPVIVFAAFPSPADHRYYYARWTGRKWVRREITRAGGSISLDGKEAYYSGGITLDHEDPSVVYLSRDISGIHQVETWKTSDGGASWTKTSVTVGDTANNLRPISPRGFLPFSGDFSVVWIRGVYNSYIDYQTSVTTQLATGGNAPPIASMRAKPASGPAPLPVTLDGTSTRDPDGTVASYAWDFADGATSTGTAATASHTYTEPGRYWPRLTATDDAGRASSYVTEVVVDPPQAPSVTTGSPTAVTSVSATLNGTVNPHNQATTFRVDYGTTTAYGSSTDDAEVTPADGSTHPVAADVTGLSAGTTYHYRLVATNATGTTYGADATFTASETQSSVYRDAILATPGLLAYWRLGDASGTIAADASGANDGTYLGGFSLLQAGALAGDPDAAAGFDGTDGEMSARGPATARTLTLEGWFDWHSGVAVARDNTSSGGWILAYDAGGALRARAGGVTIPTSVATSSLRPGWHHYALTSDGATATLYVDGQPAGSATAGSATPAMPWHVMRNGTTTQYSEGRADEVAIYGSALTSDTVRTHYEAGRTG